MLAHGILNRHAQWWGLDPAGRQTCWGGALEVSGLRLDSPTSLYTNIEEYGKIQKNISSTWNYLSMYKKIYKYFRICKDNDGYSIYGLGAVDWKSSQCQPQDPHGLAKDPSKIASQPKSVSPSQ